MSALVRFAVVSSFLATAVASIAAPPVGAALGAGEWSPPVSGPVVRGFDPPATRFGPGHLGIDYAVAPHTPVRAAGDGIVVFAGRVGSGLYAVTRHGDIRTTDSFLATVAVIAGQVVRRGAILGTSGGTGTGHRSSVLHFGVRVGDTDVDPMLLFAPLDLAVVVHLAPPRDGSSSDGPSSDGPSSETVPERVAIAQALRVNALRAAPPPSWWNEVPATAPDTLPPPVVPTAQRRRGTH